MTDEQKNKAVEEMAKQMYKQFIDKFNYVPSCDYENATLDGLPFLDIAQCLIEIGYRPEAEVRADTVKEFAGEATKAINYEWDNYNTKDKPDTYWRGKRNGLFTAINTINELAEQFGKE